MAIIEPMTCDEGRHHSALVGETISEAISEVISEAISETISEVISEVISERPSARPSARPSTRSCEIFRANPSQSVEEPPHHVHAELHVGAGTRMKLCVNLGRGFFD